MTSTPDDGLRPPDAVPEVPDDQAVGMVSIPPERVAELEARAREFVAELAAADPDSDAFRRKIAGFSLLGDAEMRASSNASRQLLDRPAASLAAARGKQVPSDPQYGVIRTLQQLRATVSDFDPQHLTGRNRMLARLPGGRRLRQYVQRFESAQKQLDGIVESLDHGQEWLRRDNGEIEKERAALWSTTERLNEYVTLAAALDAATVARAAELRVTDPERANRLEKEALFPIRQRRQDLTTQIAVSVQAYLALDVIRQNNVELIKGVERAKTTTVSALRTAVVVAQALENQRLVIDQLGALHQSTNALIGRTGEVLREQTEQVQKEQTTSAVDVEVLQRAFDNVFATMDSIDTYRTRAIDSMATTVDALERQVARSRGYLRRSRNAAAGSGAAGTGGPGAGPVI
ncbi:toxic anion resistance protein [uncultured Leifsonia sp.]|uniref:toxic anion resistance protein n=1 Tax=Leifsonia sp. TaxID=1870902 RepID=UPI0028D06095|nr:toxic anion resistance protein [uncultured Leifsonia sp.]